MITHKLPGQTGDKMGEEHSKLSGGNFDEQMEQDGKMQYRRWGGRGLKGTRMEVPPPFAILQASRGAERR